LAAFDEVDRTRLETVVEFLMDTIEMPSKIFTS
jgi:hypothetical protein